MSLEPAPGRSLWATVPHRPWQVDGSSQPAGHQRLPAVSSHEVLKGQRTS